LAGHTTSPRREGTGKVAEKIKREIEGGKNNLHTQTDAWRTILNDLYNSEVPGFGPHRFRHTRVVEWLAAGITLEEISGMVVTSVRCWRSTAGSQRYWPGREIRWLLDCEPQAGHN
jgi:hypothetical protein